MAVGSSVDEGRSARLLPRTPQPQSVGEVRPGRSSRTRHCHFGRVPCVRERVPQRFRYPIPISSIVAREAISHALRPSPPLLSLLPPPPPAHPRADTRRTRPAHPCGRSWNFCARRVLNHIFSLPVSLSNSLQLPLLPLITFTTDSFR
jgi:hypothetical protein